MIHLSSPGKSQHLDLRGLRHHVRSWGREDAPTLWLLHGWLDTSETFAALAAPLAQDFHIRALDWRGCGFSSWAPGEYAFTDYLADLDALFDALAPQGAVDLIGHSLGAQVASIYAGLRPQRVARLALLDGLALPDMPAEQAPRRLRLWLDDMRQPPRDIRYPDFAALAARVGEMHPQLSAEKAAWVAACWGCADGEGCVRLRADPKHRRPFSGLYRLAESQAIWREVTAPTLFIDGLRSDLYQRLTAEDHAARRDCFRSHRTVSVDGGHMLHFDAPEAAAQHLYDFFSAV